jgi:ferredoxin
VVVCPVDCFYEGPNFLAINPDECIDCGVCIPECPVNAIVEENDLPDSERTYWFDINERLSQKWPNITKRKEPLPDADGWKDIADKRSSLKEE